MIFIKSEGKPRDDLYMFLIDGKYGGPLISNPIVLLYDFKNREWSIHIDNGK